MEVSCVRGTVGPEGITTTEGPACPGAGEKCLRLGELSWAPIQCVLVQQASQKVARIPEKRVEAEVWWHSPSGLRSECP